jgi:hypothetical protein
LKGGNMPAIEDINTLLAKYNVHFWNQKDCLGMLTK